MTVTQSPADKRRDKITRAAADVFIRYGFARTTMGDIATAAGIARPTLYLSFPQKQDIYAAVIDMLVARALARLTSDLAQIPDAADKLRHACLSWGLEGYDLVQANPDAKDLFDLSYEPVRRGHAAFWRLLSEILAAGGCDDADMTAQMISAAIKGFKSIAEDRDALIRMIVVLCDAVTRPGNRG
ncbi:MAG: helix-turn-helix domain-containing protein [Paracoccus sp. (in: a-proteobacteria)]|nr:helix-turn-helix domain-containing protein [Paracoccus sp. (in: a-proteobacteria)]